MRKIRFLDAHRNILYESENYKSTSFAHDVLELHNPTIFPCLSLLPVTSTDVTPHYGVAGRADIFEAKFDIVRFSLEEPARLANPKTFPAINIIPRVGAQVNLGAASETWMLLINGVFYHRVSWRDLGHKDKRAGLSATREGKKCFYVKELAKANEEPMKARLLEAIGAVI